jgi:hypothetical protein
LRAATRLSRLLRAKPRSSSSIKLPTFRLMNREIQLSELSKEHYSSLKIGTPLGVFTTGPENLKQYKMQEKAYPFPSGEHDMWCRSHRRTWCGVQL